MQAYFWVVADKPQEMQSNHVKGHTTLLIYFVKYVVYVIFNNKLVKTPDAFSFKVTYSLNADKTSKAIKIGKPTQ